MAATMHSHAHSPHPAALIHTPLCAHSYHPCAFLYSCAHSYPPCFPCTCLHLFVPPPTLIYTPLFVSPPHLFIPPPVHVGTPFAHSYPPCFPRTCLHLFVPLPPLVYTPLFVPPQVFVSLGLLHFHLHLCHNVGWACLRSHGLV